MTPEEVVFCARKLADDLLFPAAQTTDRADAVPRANLDAIADAGLYGIAGRPEHGGLQVPSSPCATDVIEALASGCLTTAFVWIQHHSLVRSLYSGPDGLAEEWLPKLCRGEQRAGVIFTGLLPGQPKLRATPTTGGWRLDGVAEWVTGWGLVDVLLVMARDDHNSVVSLLLDARPQDDSP